MSYQSKDDGRASSTARATRRRPATWPTYEKDVKGFVDLGLSPTCRAFRCSSPTSTSRCRRTCRGYHTGSTAGSTTARWSRADRQRVAMLRPARFDDGIAARRCPSLIGVVIVTFLLTRALPGDPAAYFAGPAATQAGDRADPRQARPRQAADRAVRPLRQRSRARRSRQLAHHRPAGGRPRSRTGCRRRPN